MASSGGGAFLPGDPPPSSGQSLTNPTVAGSALVAPVISGAATIASGATITTPTILMTAQAVTATGATGSNAAALSAVTPCLVLAGGTSGAGIAFATGAAVAGAFYVIKNNTTGALNVYAVGGTINGTTGTTAYAISATGNLTATAMCVTAGQWHVGGNT